jgi:ribosomal protein S12 methylthiotransferase
MPRRSRNTPPTVAFVSLGCPKNLVDSEKMLGLLASAGVAPVPCESGDPTFARADVVVVNTCGFLEASKDESLGVIREALAAKEQGHIRKVVVAGCLVQRHRAKMLEWAPGIDALVGVFDRDHIVDAVLGTNPEHRRTTPDADAPRYWIAGNALVAARDRGVATAGLTVNGKDARGIGYFEDDSARLRLTPRHYAYLRISEGCNQNCAFCTIPSIRGKMRSKHPDAILREARELIADGAFELLLIGQDTTSYADDIGLGLRRQDGRWTGGLPALLRALSDCMVEMGIRGWLRLMYAYPSNFSEPIVEAFAELTRRGCLVPYLDIPLQHASDRILSAMRRNVSARRQRDLIARLREAVPGIAIRTTFISGFPGETEEDHRELLAFVQDMRFEAVGVFEYSPEPGTPAHALEASPALRVPPEEKARRRDEIMSLQQKIAFERAAAIAAQFDSASALNADGTPAGCCFDVIIDRALRTRGRDTTGVNRAGRLYEGRTYFQAPQIDAVTFVHSREQRAPGEVVRCVITGSDGYDLIGTPVEELERRVSLKVVSREVGRRRE